MPYGLTEHWLLLLLISAIVFVIAFQLGDTASVARRVFFDFVFLIALPLGVLVSWALVLLSAVTELPVPVWQALIAGLALACGWLASAIFKELDAARSKAERLRDYHKALYAEIRNAMSVLWGEGEGEKQGAATLAAMSANHGFVPFIPAERYDHVYDAIIDKIEVLPRQTIDAIVAYYGQIKSVAAIADDMRAEGFRDLPQDRRILVYQDFLEMRVRAFDLGQYALKLIAAYASDGGDAADAVTRALSNPDAGQTVRSPGSE